MKPLPDNLLRHHHAGQCRSAAIYIDVLADIIEKPGNTTLKPKCAHLARDMA